MEAQLVGPPVDLAPLHARTGQPDGEPMRVMVAAGELLLRVSHLQTRSPTEFGAADHQRVVPQTPLLQVLQQTGDRTIDPGTRAGVQFLQLVMRIPLAVITQVDQRISHTPLGQATRRQQPPAIDRGRLVVDAVQFLDRRSLLGQVDRLGNRPLHPIGQLVGLDPSPHVGVLGILDRRQPVQSVDEIELVSLLGRQHARPPAAKRQRVARIQRQLDSRMYRTQVVGVEVPTHPRVLVLAQEHERRQVFVAGPQAIVDP